MSDEKLVNYHSAPIPMVIIWRRIRRRRTQTLYFNDFCDEFFWDDFVIPDAEYPSQEFMIKLGKETSTDI